MSAKMNVPNLRFPEFSGEWKEKKLQDVSTINPKIKELPESFIYIDLGSVKKGILRKSNTILYIDAPSRAQRLLNKKDILFQMVRPYQKNNYFFNLEGHYVASTGYAQIRAVESSEYLYQFLHTNKFVNDVLTRCTGTSYPAINSFDLSTVKLNLPSKPEQQKIASFLSTVDSKIEQLTKKQSLLASYKKGVMQEIFSQMIRFKADDGSDYPEWEEKRLREIAKRNTAKNKDNRINSVLTNSATQGIVDQRDYFDKDIANQNNLDGYYIVETDTFVYNPRISTHAPVGPINRNHLSVGVMSPLYTVFTFAGVNLDFMEAYFHTTQWHRYMCGIANYGARHDRMNITKDDFLKMPILLPSTEEQRKIAIFLASIDTKINQNNQQLHQAKQFKKALLQQMFV